MEYVGKGLAWLGFWVFLSVIWYCDYKMYLAGHDTMLFTHKTDVEKKLRDELIGAGIEPTH